MSQRAGYTHPAADEVPAAGAAAVAGMISTISPTAFAWCSLDPVSGMRLYMWSYVYIQNIISGSVTLTNSLCKIKELFRNLHR